MTLTPTKWEIVKYTSMAHMRTVWKERANVNPNLYSINSNILISIILKPTMYLLPAWKIILSWTMTFCKELERWQISDQISKEWIGLHTFSTGIPNLLAVQIIPNLWTSQFNIHTSLFVLIFWMDCWSVMNLLSRQTIKKFLKLTKNCIFINLAYHLFLQQHGEEINSLSLWLS